MGVKIGNLDIDSFKVGSASCKVCLGDVQIYPQSHDYSQDYLTFVALEDGTFSFSGRATTTANTLEYSVDSGSTWSTLQNGGTTPTVTSGNTILWKASGLIIGTGIGQFLSTGQFEVEGNIMSLHFGDNFSGQTTIQNNYQFRKLFSGVTTITSAENMVLPATTLKQQCYSQMFQGCTNLVKTPKTIGSSAMTWSGDYCWSDMFHGCTSLVNAPQLPATTLGTQCYWFMFQDCTSLETAPVLPAITLNHQCYQGMLVF